MGDIDFTVPPAWATIANPLALTFDILLSLTEMSVNIYLAAGLLKRFALKRIIQIRINAP